MTRTTLLCLTAVFGMLVITLLDESPPAVAQAEDGAANSLLARVEALEETVAAQDLALLELQWTLAHVTRSDDTINGLVGPHLILEGVNVHVRSGSGITNSAVNGVGNLVVGYNEPNPLAIPRVGSHNLVVGRGHGYSSWGGLVAGFGNDTSGGAGSVTGGSGNLASGFASSVSGGLLNEASGNRSSVSGGELNVASGRESSVSGGSMRTASGEFDWVAGNLFEDD